MQQLPLYAQNIIVFVTFKSSTGWYVADKELWFLDLRKFADAFISKGYAVPNPEDFSDRFNIPVVNEDTASAFLLCIQDCKASADELKQVLEQKTYDHISDMVPSLYVNFDEKRLLSSYPEPASYEQFVPDGWIGLYGSWLACVPEEHRFWSSLESPFIGNFR